MTSSATELIEQFVKLTRKLSPEQLKELDEQILAETQNLRFVPNPGPQTAAYYSQADELYYGGAGGGGKTALICGLAVNEHYDIQMFRREAVQLRGLVKELTKIIGTREGFNSQLGVWRLASGQTIELAGVKDEDDKEKWQGREADLKCVAAGTPVLMADGAYKPIERIVVGDLVATLSGPRRVTRHLRKWAAAVRVTAAVKGRQIAQQTQGVTHRLLTPEGWVSQCVEPTSRDAASELAPARCTTTAPPPAVRPARSLGRLLQRESGQPRHRLANDRAERGWAGAGHAACHCEICAPKERHAAHRCAGSLWASCEAPSPAAPTQSGGRSLLQESARCRADCRCRSGFAVAAAERDQGSDYAGSACRIAKAGRPLSGSDLPMRLPPVLRSIEVGSWPWPQVRACECAPCDPSPRDCPGDCWTGTRRDGGRLRWGGEVYLACLPPPDDAAGHSPRSSPADDEACTQECSRPLRSYRHPYRWEIHSTGASVCVASLTVTPAGHMQLFDLTVEDANHYITAGGFINKNCFDEISHFSRHQYRFIIGWNRTTRPNQRCRVVATGNPPMTAQGLWVIQEWAPWLDETHPDPADPGELRWPVRQSDEEGEEPREFFFRTKEEAIAHLETLRSAPRDLDGDILPPRSRTFIAAALEDNPDLMRTGYAAVIEAMPKEVRAALKGSFKGSLSDQAAQVIPTQWIIAAQERWRSDGYKAFPMTAMGFDPAGGGRDSAELAWRHGGWYAPFVSAQGEITADGSAAAANIIRHRRDNAPVVIDVGGGAGHGFGGTTIMRLRDNGITPQPFNGAGPSQLRTQDKQLTFANKRAEAWWKFREALDPDQEGGSPIALPPDPELRADLAAPTFEVTAKGILVEDKKNIKTRLGRSPGKGDAAVMAYSEGNAAIRRGLTAGGRPASRPEVQVGHAAKKARRRG